MSNVCDVEVSFDYLDMLVKRLDTIPVRKFLKDLMLDAKKMVIKAYGSQPFSGNEDFTATVRTTPMSATLTVRGEDVGFLEFGAGLATEWDEFASKVPYSVAPGSYSMWHGEKMGQFARTGLNFWYYERVKYTAIAPTRGMQYTLDELRRTITDYMRKRIASWLVNGK